MRLRDLIIMMLILISNINIYAKEISYKDVCNAPNIRWNCSDIDKYQGILSSFQNNDIRIYATKLKDKFKPYCNPETSEKYIWTITEINIDNPLFNADNLLNHISIWLKDRKEGWEKSIKINKTENRIISSAYVNIAENSSFLYLYKVYIEPSLLIQVKDGNKLVVSLMEKNYINQEYNGSNQRLISTYTPNITDVFPFVPKSSYKQTYSRAYIGTYQYNWNFIATLVNDLNANFSKDQKLITDLHYQFSNDSLKALYGEPSRIIALQSSSNDVNTELRFYENAKKIVFMGHTINFKDIINCNIIDDPQFIPGHSTSYGGGISFFGIGIGGSDTYTTPDKTIHNYVVDIKIDKLSLPFVRIATGQNEFRAKEIASIFDYILRHQQGIKGNSSRNNTTARKRRR